MEFLASSQCVSQERVSVQQAALLVLHKEDLPAASPVAALIKPGTCTHLILLELLNN